MHPLPDAPLLCHITVAPDREGALSVAEWVRWVDTLPEAVRQVRVEAGHTPVEEVVPLLKALAARRVLVEPVIAGFGRNPEPVLAILARLQGFSALYLHLDRTATEDLAQSMERAARYALPVHTLTPIRPSTRPLVDEVVELCEARGGKRAVFYRDCTARADPVHHGAPGEVRGGGNWEEEFLEALDRKVGEGYRVGVEGCFPRCFSPGLRGQGCSGGIYSVTVDPRGQVFPCQGAREACGNLREADLATLWSSPGMARWRELPHPLCQGCPAPPTCGGGGKGERFAGVAGGDPLVRGAEGLLHLPETRWNAVPAGARPILTGRRLDRPGCVVLHQVKDLRSYRILPGEDRPLLDCLNGLHTRGELEERFHPRGREVLQQLYLDRLLSFRPPGSGGCLSPGKRS